MIFAQETHRRRGVRNEQRNGGVTVMIHFTGDYARALRRGFDDELGERICIRSEPADHRDALGFASLSPQGLRVRGGSDYDVIPLRAR